MGGRTMSVTKEVTTLVNAAASLDRERGVGY